MQIGSYKLLPVETGMFALDGGAMFGVVPKNLWQRSNPADEQNRIDLAMRALLLQGSGRNILIDCGIGNKFDQKWAAIYKINHSGINLHKSLGQYGLTPQDITDLILTHLHFDHVGGATFFKDGSLQLTFPNANYYVQEEQWNWAMTPSLKDRASFLAENLLPLEKSGRLHLIKAENIPWPDIQLHVMSGHTPGMQLIQIGHRDRSVLYCADLIPTRTHIPVPWVMAYDNHPMQTMSEKSKLLTEAVNNKWLLFYEHDPRFTAGYVDLDPEKGFLPGTSFTISDFNNV